MIQLTHPVHGTKHAYLEAEALADEKNGWVRAGKEAKPVEEAPPLEIAAPDAREVLAEAYRQKFGKKPHHKMTAKTIAEALK